MAETTYYVDPDVPGGGAGDGSSWANAYSSLNAAEQARNADISGGNAVVFQCRASGGTADTTAVNVSGWTTDADSYVKVYCATADTGGRHAGVWSTAKYRLSAAAFVFQINEEYVRVEGVQIEKTSSSANDQSVVQVGSSLGTGILYISACLIKSHNGTTYREAGVTVNDADITAYIWNTVIYGIARVNSLYGYGIAGLGPLNVYSCTIAGGNYSIRCAGSTMTVKNTYCGNSLTEDFYREAGTLNKTNCASEDQSADDTGTGENATNCVADAVAFTTSTFVNVTSGSENFHLVVGSALIGVGTDTSGESAPLNFTVDIDGDTRS